jgi:hypothetical protein
MAASLVIVPASSSAAMAAMLDTTTIVPESRQAPSPRYGFVVGAKTLMLFPALLQ